MDISQTKTQKCTIPTQNGCLYVELMKVCNYNIHYERSEETDNEPFFSWIDKYKRDEEINGEPYPYEINEYEPCPFGRS